jgi:hypothetical protein
MSDRSVELAKQSISGTSKYDYFIVGIGAATFSYFAKDFVSPNSFGIDEGSLVIVSLLCLALSVVFGLKKIERHNKFLEKNGKYLDYSEHLATYKKNAIEGGEAINSENGELLTPEKSRIKAAALEKLLPEWKSSLEKLGGTIWWCSVIRDYGVFIAYCSLAIGKLLPLIRL